MATLEELKRERDKLKSQREVRESFARRNQEKRQIQSEIRREKHPGLYNFGSLLGQASMKASNAAARYVQKKSAVSRKASKRRMGGRVPKQRQPTNLNQALYG